MLFSLLVSWLGANGPSVAAQSWHEHELPTIHLGASARLTVRLPSGFRASDDTRYPVLYLLPVSTRRDEPAIALRALGECAAAERFIVVMPWFDTTPWHANHQGDPQRQHERHLLEVVIPFVDRTYSTIATAAGRSLLGFSKSGWGAFSLILRHPEIFGFAASWDAPLGLRDADYGIWGTAAQFGSLECFHEFHPWILMERRSGCFRDAPPRLVLAGSALFGPEPHGRYASDPHTEATHARMKALHIPHRYLPNSNFSHTWSGGWLPTIMEALLELQETSLSALPPRM